jgi:hypothetical protein
MVEKRRKKGRESSAFHSRPKKKPRCLMHSNDINLMEPRKDEKGSLSVKK